MPVLLMTGTLGDQPMTLRCTDSDLEGPEPVTNWILETLGEQPYTLDAMRTLAPRLTRLFGASLQVEEVEETESPHATPEPEEPAPTPEPAPAPDTPQPEPIGEPV